MLLQVREGMAVIEARLLSITDRVQTQQTAAELLATTVAVLGQTDVAQSSVTELPRKHATAAQAVSTVAGRGETTVPPDFTANSSREAAAVLQAANTEQQQGLSTENQAASPDCQQAGAAVELNVKTDALPQQAATPQDASSGVQPEEATAQQASSEPVSYSAGVKREEAAVHEQVLSEPLGADPKALESSVPPKVGHMGTACDDMWIDMC